MTPPPNPRSRGFTLIELMIAVAVIAILAAVAYPSYRDQITKSHRADAKTALLALAQRMERFYTERSTYVGASVGAAGIYPNKSDQGYYNLSITAQTADAFTIKAAPTGQQAGDKCGSYLFNQLGQKTLDVDATLTVAACW